MAMGGGAAARLVVLCGVLAGLFLMHGSPAAAAGCHEAMGGAGAVVVMQTTGHPAAEMDHAAVTAEHPHGASAVCVSTGARGGVPLAAPGPAPAVLAVAALPAPVRAPTGTADGSRAPPGGGRALLLQVCVART